MGACLFIWFLSTSIITPAASGHIYLSLAVWHKPAGLGHIYGVCISEDMDMPHSTEYILRSYRRKPSHLNWPASVSHEPGVDTSFHTLNLIYKSNLHIIQTGGIALCMK